MPRVTNRHGTSVNYIAAISHMDDDLVDEVVRKCSPCSNQRFFNEYEDAYLRKFGTEWEFSKQNPVY